MIAARAARVAGHGYRDDRGIAVLWSTVLIAVIAFAALVAVSLGSLAVTRQRAAAVADIAALAGAQSLGDRCASAAAVVSDNGLRLSACRVEGDDVVVRVAAPAPAIVGRLMALVGAGVHDQVQVSARAGLPAG